LPVTSWRSAPTCSFWPRWWVTATSGWPSSTPTSCQDTLSGHETSSASTCRQLRRRPMGRVPRLSPRKRPQTSLVAPTNPRAGT